MQASKVVLSRDTLVLPFKTRSDSPEAEKALGFAWEAVNTEPDNPFWEGPDIVMRYPELSRGMLLRQIPGKLIMALINVNYEVSWRIDEEGWPFSGELFLTPSEEEPTRGEWLFGADREKIREQYDVHLYGQPRFVQEEVAFAYEINGKLQAAFPLLTLETGWGDGGNINLFVGLDERRRPVEAFLEASCH